MSSLHSNTPDLDDPDSISGTFVKLGYIYIKSYIKFKFTGHESSRS